MKVISSISKSKIPSKFSCVLQSIKLDEFLENNNFIIHTSLDFWIQKELGNFFEAFFWFPSGNILYNRLFIRAGALLKNDAKSARTQLYTNVFPKFGNWLKGILELPNNSASLYGKPYFGACYKNDTVKIITTYH